MTDIDDPDETVDWGTSVDSFMTEAASSDKVIYFHNLRFDGTFIVDYLMRNGYKWSTDSRKMRRGHFFALISGGGAWYSIKVAFKNGRSVEFRDSFKKLPMSVSTLAPAFGMKMTKGELDYHLDRPEGWQPTVEELDYLFRDILIVSNAMRVVLEEGATHLTVGADSLAEYKKVITNKAFGRFFPVLPIDIDEDIRKAYRGGFTYATERYRRKVVGKGRTFDVNSLYPSVMYNCRLPFGFPEPLDELPDFRDETSLFICEIVITARLKPNHVPCIQIKNSGRFVSTEYLTEIAEPTVISASSVDLRLWADHYDLEILEFRSGWHFRSGHGMFKQFIDKWSAIKANAKGGKRALAKLHLNSLYGKFATNPDVTGKVVTFDEGKDRIVLIAGEPEQRDPIYTAMGVFITAYAREITIRAAQAHYDEFAYADTDSLHLLGEGMPEGLDIHPSRLGAWKHEYDFKSAVFSRAKCYTELRTECPHKIVRIQTTRRWSDYSDWRQTEHEDECYETHIAGMPAGMAETVRFKHHVKGHEFDGKLMPKIVPGGTLLVETTFKLNMRDPLV